MKQSLQSPLADKLARPGYSLIWLVLLLAALCLPGGVGSSQAQAGGDFAAVDDYVERRLVDDRIPGLALAIVEGDQIVYAQGYGEAAPGRAMSVDTPLLIGSTGKAITATAVLQLVEQGLIDLDAPVQDYLPWFTLKDGPGLEPDSARRITVEMLLHHSSGIPTNATERLIPIDNRDEDAIEQAVRSLAQVESWAEPGTAYAYSNANYQVAGLIVQVVSGMAYGDYLEQRIFTPLEMTHSASSPEDALALGSALGYRYWFGYPLAGSNNIFPGGTLPSGYLWSSASDMAHFLIAHMNDGQYREARILSADSIELAHEPALDDYGMGWVNTGWTLEHNGAVQNFGSQVLIDRYSERGIVVLWNVNHLDRDFLYTLAPDINAVIEDRPLTPAVLRTGSRSLTLNLSIMLATNLIWIVMLLTRRTLWQGQPERRPQSWKLALWIGLPLLLGAVQAYLILSPMDVGIRLLWSFAPDLTSMALLVLLISVIWLILLATTLLPSMKLSNPKGFHRVNQTNAAADR